MTHEKNPVDQIAFWRKRIFETFATGGMLHQCILNDSYDLWCKIQAQWADILKEVIRPGLRVLDAGCGYGALIGCFEEARFDVEYTGVDFSPDLIELARYRYPKRRFFVADLRELPFENGHFDWAVVRSVDGMIIANAGNEAWAPMLKELKRTCGRLLIGGYMEKLDERVVWEVMEGCHSW